MKKDKNYHLLVNTKDELNYLVSCILQTNAKDASRFVDIVGKVTVSKISASGATVGIMSLIASLGTAGTGTAIASLHGASATNAILAWLGGFVGGSILTGGLGFAVGIGTYKMLSSKARDYGVIGERERYFVDSCIILIKYINEWLETNQLIETEPLKIFSQNFLAPLTKELFLEVDDLTKPLDTKNSILLKAHVTLTLQRYLGEYEKLEVIKGKTNA